MFQCFDLCRHILRYLFTARSLDLYQMSRLVPLLDRRRQIETRVLCSNPGAKFVQNLRGLDRRDQRVGSYPVIKGHSWNSTKGPSKLGRVNPKLPVLHQRHRGIISSAVQPYLLPEEGAGINIVFIQDVRQIEFLYLHDPVSQAELIAITVNDSDRGLRVQNRYGIGNETGRKTVVIVKRKNVSSPRNSNRGVARGRQAHVLLIDHEITGCFQQRDYLERTSFG